MKRKPQPETEITKLIIAKLEDNGFTVKRIYNGGLPGGVNFKTNQVRYKKKKQEDKGIPDLLAYNLKKKLFLFIEVKSAVGRVSTEQLEFNNDFNTCHHFHALYSRGTEDILKFLQMYED